MVHLTQSTKPVKEKEIKRSWHLVDMKGEVLGRAVPRISKFLQGKHKRNYVAYLDFGDYVIVINASKVMVTGKKSGDKIYTRYSGFPGGLKKITFGGLLEKKPSEIIRHAVSGMLPKNKHRDRRLARLFVFPDENHPYKDKF
ncbi:50S ribosomal protein L13 [Candidatus Roizmanbacteria bacterium]|nr:50S ribosomal protein L13 [Candidatus Roizmanbacteria bacterium]